MKKALLIVAHGSRREASNTEVKILTEAVVPRIAESYSIVECAFLELADPLIPEGMKRCVQRGATSVTVLPYFLSAGRHVSHDIPEIIALEKRIYPEVSMQIIEHIGGSSKMVDYLSFLVDERIVK
ncbi:MAG: CbiX/SirB N-terminal domain-containing protein [Epsilonproteobacteria bacterium]|nr:CbiX/SirB N-terminal domain-containing protein [Campylobacterota bacterium]